MLYLCYDSALNETYTLVKLMQHYPGYISLFKGTDDESIWDAAPYLFTVEDDFYEMRTDPFIKLDHCILFQTKESNEETCRFLQYYMYGETEGQSFYHRIWDARIFKRGISQWNEKETVKFFSFFETVYTEAEADDMLDKWLLNNFSKPVPIVIKRSDVLSPYIDNLNWQVTNTDYGTDKEQTFFQSELKADEEQQTALSKRRNFFIE